MQKTIKVTAQAAVFIVGSVAMVGICTYLVAKTAGKRMFWWVIRHDKPITS